MLQQETVDTTRVERSLPKTADQLRLGIPDTVSGHYYMFYLRLHLTLSPTRGQSVLFRCFAGVQEASTIRLQSDV